MYMFLYAIEQTGGKESESEREKNQHVKNGFISGMELMPLQCEKILLLYFFFVSSFKFAMVMMIMMM